MSVNHLVLLPGLYGTGRMFEPLLKLLPPDFTASVVAYPAEQKLSYQQLMPYVLQACPATAPFILVAESFSGPLAVALAATKPKNLQALVLCASFVSNPTPPLMRWIQPFNIPFWFRFKPSPLFVRHVAAMQDCDPAVLERLTKSTISVPPEVLAFRVAQALNVDVREQLQNCQLPILYLRGKRDLLVRLRNWREIARLKPEVQYVEIDASHFVLQHKPADSLAAIKAFLIANSGL